MAYPAEKTLDDEFEDERLSTEESLLPSRTGHSNHSFRTMKGVWTRQWILPILLHVGLLILYLFLFLFALWKLHEDHTCRTASTIDSSATSSIEYGTRVFDEIDDLDFYFGKPTPELDAKWHSLLQYQWLQVPESDMVKLGRTEEGIKLPGGGYFGTLAVFHDLHCLRRVHHAFYRDYYFPNMTEEERDLDMRHAAHCLDSLRQSVQCAGDVSLLTMKWSGYTREPTANFTSPHECVNFDHIQDWAQKHVYDVMAPGVLVHPVLGPSYPDGKPGLGVGRGPE